MNNNYEDLANNIIIQAYSDYVSAGKMILKADERDKNVYKRYLIRAERMASDCRRFFESKWYATLTSLDSHYLLEKASEELASLLSNYKLNDEKRLLLSQYYELTF